MKNILFLFAFLLITTLGAQETSQLKLSIYFETASSELTPDSKQKMDDFTLQLLNKPDFDIQIEAYTDDRGTIEYNQKLAEKRANSTFTYLLSKNIHPKSSHVISHGKTQQVWLEDEVLRRKENRRVDLIATTYYFTSFADIKNRLQQEQNQEISFQNSKGKTITTPKGTILEIPSDAFVFEDGSIPTGKIDFQIKEAFKASDWFLNNLSTETIDGKLLQTAGMVYTDATSEGRKVKLIEGKSIKITIPSESKPINDMELFYGQQHDQSEGIIWKPTNEKESLISDPKKRRKKIPFTKETINSLKTLVFEIPEKPALVNYSTLTFPTKPQKPRKPSFRAKKPKREDFVFRAYSFKDKFKSKKEKEAIAQQKYEKHLKQYKNNIIRHDKLMVEYKQNLERYEKDLDTYHKKITEWEDETYKRMYARFQYLENIDQYTAINSLSITCKNGKLIPMICGDGKGLITQIARTSHYYDHLSSAVIDLQIKEASIAKSYHDDYHKSYAKVYKKVPQPKTIKFNRIDFLRSIPKLVEREETVLQNKLESCIELEGTRSAFAYVANIRQLGWCNIDRFFKRFRRNQFVNVDVKENEDAMLMVILTNEKVSMGFKKLNSGKYRTLFNLPKGLKAQLVSMKIKNGIAQIAIHPFTIGNMIPELIYKTIPISDLRQELKRLDG